MAWQPLRTTKKLHTKCVLTFNINLRNFVGEFQSFQREYARFAQGWKSSPCWFCSIQAGHVNSPRWTTKSCFTSVWAVLHTSLHYWQRTFFWTMWPYLNKPKENTTLLSWPYDTQSLKERKASKALKGSGEVKVKLLWGLTQHEPFTMTSIKHTVTLWTLNVKHMVSLTVVAEIGIQSLKAAFMVGRH